MVDTIGIVVLGVILAIVLAIVGIVLMIIDAVRGSEEEGSEGGRAKYGGVVVVGPIPIVFGNDSSVVKWAIILTIVVVVVFLLLLLLPMLGV